MRTGTIDFFHFIYCIRFLSGIEGGVQRGQAPCKFCLASLWLAKQGTCQTLPQFVPQPDAWNQSGMNTCKEPIRKCIRYGYCMDDIWLSILVQIQSVIPTNWLTQWGDWPTCIWLKKNISFYDNGSHATSNR